MSNVGYRRHKDRCPCPPILVMLLKLGQFLSTTYGMLQTVSDCPDMNTKPRYNEALVTKYEGYELASIHIMQYMHYEVQKYVLYNEVETICLYSC